MDPTESTLTALDPTPVLAPSLTGGVLLNPTEGTLTALDPMEGVPTLTAPDPMERMSMLMALDPTEGKPMSTALGLMEGMSMSTALYLADGMVFLTAPDLRHPTPTECMAFLTTPDPTAGPVQAGRLPVPGSEDDLNQCPNYLLGAANWGQVTATSSETSDTRIPTSRTTPKGRSLRPTASGMASYKGLPALGSAQDWHLSLCSMASYRVLAPASPLTHDESCPSLSALGSALGSVQEWHLNLCPMALYYVLALAGPLVKDESCPSLSALGSAEACYLNLCPMARYYVLAPGSSDPLVENESCPSLLTPSSAEEDHLNPLATLGNATTAPAPTDSVSLMTSSSAAYPSCLLRSSTTYPMGSNVSVQLSHPRPHRHVSLGVLLQEPRVRSR